MWARMEKKSNSHTENTVNFFEINYDNINYSSIYNGSPQSAEDTN